MKLEEFIKEAKASGNEILFIAETIVDLRNELDDLQQKYMQPMIDKRLAQLEAKHKRSVKSSK